MRFTNINDKDRSHVMRKHHGHSEDIFTNLPALKITVERQRQQSPSGNIAAQFVYLDTLWYALREVPLGDLEENLRPILYSQPSGESGMMMHISTSMPFWTTRQ